MDSKRCVRCFKCRDLFTSQDLLQEHFTKEHGVPSTDKHLNRMIKGRVTPPSVESTEVQQFTNHFSMVFNWLQMKKKNRDMRSQIELAGDVYEDFNYWTLGKDEISEIKLFYSENILGTFRSTTQRQQEAVTQPYPLRVVTKRTFKTAPIASSSPAKRKVVVTEANEEVVKTPASLVAKRSRKNNTLHINASSASPAKKTTDVTPPTKKITTSLPPVFSVSPKKTSNYHKPKHQKETFSSRHVATDNKLFKSQKQINFEKRFYEDQQLLQQQKHDEVLADGIDVTTESALEESEDNQSEQDALDAEMIDDRVVNEDYIPMNRAAEYEEELGPQELNFKEPEDMLEEEDNARKEIIEIGDESPDEEEGNEEEEEYGEDGDAVNTSDINGCEKAYKDT